MRIQIRIVLYFFLLAGCATQKQMASPKKDLLQVIENNFRDASAQYKLMMTRLPADRFPKTYYAQTDKQLLPQIGAVVFIPALYFICTNKQKINLY